MVSRKSVKESAKPGKGCYRINFPESIASMFIAFISLVCAGLCYFAVSEIRMGGD